MIREESEDLRAICELEKRVSEEHEKGVKSLFFILPTISFFWKTKKQTRVFRSRTDFESIAAPRSKAPTVRKQPELVICPLRPVIGAALAIVFVAPGQLQLTKTKVHVVQLLEETDLSGPVFRFRRLPRSNCFPPPEASRGRGGGGNAASASRPRDRPRHRSSKEETKEMRPRTFRCSGEPSPLSSHRISLAQKLLGNGESHPALREWEEKISVAIPIAVRSVLGVGRRSQATTAPLPTPPAIDVFSC